MCGLVGAYGNITINSEDAVQLLLHFDYLRGKHSTGVAYIDMDLSQKWEDEVVIFKALGGPWNLYSKYKEEFTSSGVYKKPCNLIIGHNRHATQGEINEDNAHPFELGDIVGAHNGTVSKFSLYDFDGHKKFAIDSQMILNELNFRTLQGVWDDADGAIALSYFDRRDQSLNLTRNKERTLYYTYAQDKTCIFWASESWMLNIALGKCGVKHSEVIALEPDSHLVFTVGEKEIEKKENKLTPFSRPVYTYTNSKGGTTTYKTYTPSSEVYRDDWSFCKAKLISWDKETDTLIAHIAWHNPCKVFIKFKGGMEGILEKRRLRKLFRRRKHVEVCFPYKDSEHIYKENSEIGEQYKNVDSYFVREFKQGEMANTFKALVKEKEEREQGGKGNIFYLGASAPYEAKVFQGQLVSKSAFDQLSARGCVWCGGAVEWKERDKLKWISQKECLCPECQDIEEVKEYVGSSGA